MPILSDGFITKQLASWAQKDYPLTLNQEIQAKDLFYKLMNEKQNATKDILTQESLLAEIARKLSYGEKPESVFRQHGDNRHMNYFDLFLEQGVSEGILEALSKNGISSEVLKGIKKNVPFDMTISDVRVVQELSDGEDTSPEVDLFQIYKNGTLIYEWTPEKDYISCDDYDNENINYDTNNFYNASPKKQYTKSGKERKSELLSTYVTPERTYTIESMRSSANPNKLIITYRDEKGRFAKKW